MKFCSDFKPDVVLNAASIIFLADKIAEVCLENNLDLTKFDLGLKISGNDIKFGLRERV